MASASNRKRRAAGAPARVLAKLQRSVESGDYYHALQMYQAQAKRYASKGKHEESREIILGGATTLLGAGQLASGAELIKLLVEAWGDEQCDEVKVLAISKVCDAVANVGAKDRSECQQRLVTLAIEWSKG